MRANPLNDLIHRDLEPVIYSGSQNDATEDKENTKIKDIDSVDHDDMSDSIFLFLD
jgi:hypothetical protein